MESQTLRKRIADAIKAGNKEELLKLKLSVQQEIWLNSFNGSIPPAAWLEDNLMVQFID